MTVFTNQTKSSTSFTNSSKSSASFTNATKNSAAFVNTSKSGIYNTSPGVLGAPLPFLMLISAVTQTVDINVYTNIAKNATIFTNFAKS